MSLVFYTMFNFQISDEI